mgnify:CR=1 FL=1
MTTADRPHIHPAERDHISRHPLGFFEIKMTYGFTDTVTLDTDLRNLIEPDLSFDPTHTTYFLTNEHLHPTHQPGMALWRDRLFTFMHRNASGPPAHFGLPADRTVGVGTHLDI